MPEHESFAAAERALANFSGHDTPNGVRPMSPEERRQAQQLIEDRKRKVVETGRQAIATMRKGVQEHGQKLISKYDAASQLFDRLEQDIEDGTVSTTDLEAALADASMLQRELSTQTDAHYANIDTALQDHDPEKYVRSIYKRYPPLARDGRVSPWHFNW